MDNIKLLFEHNKSQKGQKHSFIYMTQHNIVYSSGNILNGKEIRKLLHFIDYLKQRYSSIRLPIVFDFRNCKSIADKLSYIMFETICFELVNNQKRKVKVIFGKLNISIVTEGITKSSIRYLVPDSRYNLLHFKQKYIYDVFGKHYREIIQCNEKDENRFGKVMADVDNFLNNLGVDSKSRAALSEMSSELVGNAIEHSKSSCLLDIDISNYYKKELAGKTLEGNYYGVNISILSFSNLLFGDLLKQKLTNQKDGERYLFVKRAHLNHTKFFNNIYDENCFYTLASLQHKISGSEKKKLSGGKGMTCLINTLENQADGHNCYLLTGNKIFYFLPEYLGYNCDKWLGFNKENDFLNTMPDENCFKFCTIDFPGTAYNLNFVFKEIGDGVNE